MLCSHAARYLGAISYSLYLVNEPIHKVAGEALSRYADGNSGLFTAFWVPVAVGVPLLAAAGLHAYVEAPTQRWGRDMARRFASNRIAPTVQARG
jgi:peptidoglycan/LPS O-acetylase OafA/YrhL